jgi:urea carboxylase
MDYRYVYGGDEFIFVELSEDMRLESYFMAQAITTQLKARNLEGIIDICPASASYLVRIQPELVHPDRVIAELKEIAKRIKNFDDIQITSRIVDVPVLFDDPWTNEAQQKFRDRHQDPSSTDFEFAMRINGYANKEDFIAALTESPYLMLMLAFIPGLCNTYQLVDKDRQLQAPKYVRPRTYTPERSFGMGGALTCIYPVESAGGYQLLGRAAAPVLDTAQKLPDFKDSMVFPRQGDIYRYRSITMDEYEQIRKEVESGNFKYLCKEITYSPNDVLHHLQTFSEQVIGRLYDD